LNNAIDHGNSSAIACAQKFPNLQEVEIIVGDAGVGTYHTISRKYKTHSTLEAIKKAVEKGVTGAMDYVYGGAKRNAGMGLGWHSCSR